MSRRSKKKDNVENTAETLDKNEMTEDQQNDRIENQEEGQNEEEHPDFEAKFNEMNDKFLRLYSEFENFRRRTAKERIDLLTNAKGESLKSMLPLVDDFERAILNNENSNEVDPLKEGFSLIHSKLLSILTQSGLTPMNSKTGDDFDTDIHEAITQIPAPSPELKGKVVDIIEKGYLINDKVIRFAKVVIGS